MFEHKAQFCYHSERSIHFSVSFIVSNWKIARKTSMLMVRLGIIHYQNIRWYGYPLIIPLKCWTWYLRLCFIHSWDSIFNVSCNCTYYRRQYHGDIILELNFVGFSCSPRFFDLCRFINFFVFFFIFWFQPIIFHRFGWFY